MLEVTEVLPCGASLDRQVPDPKACVAEEGQARTDYLTKETFTLYPSSETQGQSVASGERAGRKFSSMGESAPGYRLSPSYFQKFKPMPAPDWAQKMLRIIVPNRRVLFVSSYTTAIVLPHLPGLFTKLVRARKLLFSIFLTRNEGTTDESKNVRDAISRSNSIFPENILFLTHHK